MADALIDKMAYEAVKAYWPRVRSGALTWAEVAERKAKAKRLTPMHLADLAPVVERLGEAELRRRGVVLDPRADSGASPVGQRRIRRSTRIS